MAGENTGHQLIYWFTLITFHGCRCDFDFEHTSRYPDDRLCPGPRAVLLFMSSSLQGGRDGDGRGEQLVRTRPGPGSLFVSDKLILLCLLILAAKNSFFGKKYEDMIFTDVLPLSNSSPNV